MPYEGIADGLYLAKQPGAKVKGIRVTHFGIIDVGNTLDHPQVNTDLGPTVFHQTPPRIRFQYVGAFAPWEIVGEITDIEAARARIAEAWRDPEYELLGNNCEHVAKYVATGIRASGQVIVGAVGASAAVFLAIKLFRWLTRE